MKTITIFIGLKLAEIAGVCLAYLLFSYIGMSLMIWECKACYYHEHFYHFENFGFGFFGSFIICGFIGCILLIPYSIYLIIKSNWEWSKKLSKRK